MASLLKRVDPAWRVPGGRPIQSLINSMQPPSLFFIPFFAPSHIPVRQTIPEFTDQMVDLLLLLEAFSSRVAHKKRDTHRNWLGFASLLYLSPDITATKTTGATTLSSS